MRVGSEGFHKRYGDPAFEIAARPIGWTIASTSALIGTHSHIGLDAVMHPRMRPLWRVSTAEHPLHVICVASALLGGLAIVVPTARGA